MGIVNQADINQLIILDNIFASIKHRYGNPPDWTRPQGFISLSKIILEQQVSLASANAHFLKLSNYLKGFTPENILSLTDQEMRKCQISRQKAKYLRELSATIINGDINLEELAEIDETEARKQLTNIKGIGNWTADIYLMFCLQAKDIFPSGDIAVINTVKELTGLQTKEEIILLSGKWKPYRSLATYFFWHNYLSKRNKSYDDASIFI
jgi:DNA-3-methyladenine glycosylase II